MYSFGIAKNRKQTHQTTIEPVQYLVLDSEPIDARSMPHPSLFPSFGYANHYLAKRRMMRNLRRLRKYQS